MRWKLLLLALAFVVLPAHAQLFADDDARKAILQLRQQIGTLERQVQQNQTDMAARLDTAQRSQLDLVNQLETNRQEMARLRGQIETLANEVATLQKRNRDLYADLDARIKKFEPTSMNVDGRSATVERAELAAYETPLAQFRAGDFKGSLPGFREFVARYPQSVYAPAAHYWIGSAHYALKDYKAAISAHQVLVDRYPDSARVPEALLSIAESQVQLGDRRAANRTLTRLVKDYPETDAGRIAKERLPSTR